LLASIRRITTTIVEHEIARLRTLWAAPEAAAAAGLVERFLSEAGRILFLASHTRRTTTNDADRLRKYLARFGLAWQDLRILLNGAQIWPSKRLAPLAALQAWRELTCRKEITAR
jgi:sigma54-dependent transcription regulator